MAKAKAKKIEVTEALVKESLPVAPDGYSYSVERVTPMVIKVWLNHDDANHSYTDEKVYTIHSYIKRDMVHQPKNTDKMKVSSICHLSELSEQSPWSTLNQPDNPLVDLLS
tara:strand:+ start:79 stop:411 length:333 start_codon:yes stop_codon:yes gene_type:complete